MPIWEEDQRAEPQMRRTLLVRGPSASASASSGSGQRQYRQMLAALAILAVALIVVVAKDWNFWFPSSPVASDQTSEPAADAESDQAQPADIAVGGSASAHRSAKAKANSAVAVKSAPDAAPANASGPSIVASQRTVLPPLEVEVVAGGQHRTVQPHNNSIKVDMQSESAPPTQEITPAAGSPAPQTAQEVTTEASATVRLSPEAAQVLSARPVEPSYPLLAKQMKVQGAVVLEALIGKAGAIENLRVLSGPAILSSAAMEAVKQWRFKPYFQNGRPVETQARITVNFTISTS